MTALLRSWAVALGGEVSGNSVLAPGPGHSAQDRSLSVTLSATAPNGFLVNSFAGDDPIACLDYVRAKLGLPEFSSERPRKRAYDARHGTPEAASELPCDDETKRKIDTAAWLWGRREPCSESNAPGTICGTAAMLAYSRRHSAFFPRMPNTRRR